VNALFILFVRDQARSAAFYASALGSTPVLDVPGMTEFSLGGHAGLGLMPEAGIRRLLGPGLPDPATAHGIPRSELYLVVDDPAACHARALAAGATELSPLAERPWGDLAAYGLDPDGHLVAFAKRSPLPQRAQPPEGEHPTVGAPRAG
jgi:catechol 2,3-dioxygenase-like lactoylglutathione lyase family enzyme